MQRRGGSNPGTIHRGVPGLARGHTRADRHKFDDLVAGHRFALVAVKALGIEGVGQPECGIGCLTQFIQALAGEFFLCAIGKDDIYSDTLGVDGTHANVAIGVLLEVAHVGLAFVIVNAQYFAFFTQKHVRDYPWANITEKVGEG